MKQRAVTIIKALRPGSARVVRTLLRAQGDALQARDALPAARRAQIPCDFDHVEGLHFLSFFVIDATPAEPALLVLEASFDGPRRLFLERFVRALEALVRNVYDHCTDRPPASATLPELCRYLERDNVCSELFYAGNPGRSVEQIELEQRLAGRVAQCVWSLGEPRGRRSDFVRQLWQALTSADRALVLAVPQRPFWVRHRLLQQPISTIFGLLWPFIAFIGAGMLALVLAYAYDFWPHAALEVPASVVVATKYWATVACTIAAAAVVLWLVMLVWEFPDGLTPHMIWRLFAAKMGEYITITLRAAPEFAVLLGWIALLYWHGSTIAAWLGCLLLALALLVLVLAAVAYAVLVWIGLLEMEDSVCALEWNGTRISEMRRREDRGAQNHFVSVTTIKPGWLRQAVLWTALTVIHHAASLFYNPRGLFNIQTIHFARWLIIRGRRLLFVPHYDGSFGGYLGQFSTFGASGVSSIWGNTVDFPRTFLLLAGGARDEQRFKARARASQYESLLWYRRYPDLTVTTIERNAAIREDLARFSRDSVAGGRGVREEELDAFLRRF